MAHALGPSLPTAFVSPLPSNTPTGSLITVGPGMMFTTLSAALTHVGSLDPNLNHVIEITAGVTITANHATPPKTGTGWVTIRSSRWAELPSGRVGPEHQPLMATIASPGALSAVAMSFNDESHGWRLFGLEIIVSPTAVTHPAAYVLIICGNGTGVFGGHGGWSIFNGPTRPWNHDDPRIGSRYSIDHCYIHGISDSQNIHNGIFLNGRDIRVQHNHFARLQGTTPDGCKATNCTDGPGPFLIDDNFISCLGPAFMTGGSDPSAQDLTPSDIIFTRNTVTKDLRYNPHGNTFYGGEEFAAKNLFELKHSRRVLVKGNTFENCWPSAGQDGAFMLLSCHNQEGTAPWTRVLDVTVESNVARNCYGGMFVIWQASGGGGFARIKIVNNLGIDIGNSRAGANFNQTIFMNASINQGFGPIADLWMEHNTCFRNIKYAFWLNSSATGPWYTRLTLKNNVVGSGEQGAITQGGSGATFSPMTVADMAVRAPDHEIQKNMLCEFGFTGSGYPSGFYNPANWVPGMIRRGTEVAMGISLSDGTLTASSPFKAGNADQADDGTDNGVNFAKLAADLGGALTLSRPVFTNTPYLAGATQVTGTGVAGAVVTLRRDGVIV